MISLVVWDNYVIECLFSEASMPVNSPEMIPRPYVWSVLNKFLPQKVSVMVAAANAASKSNFVLPCAKNTIEE
jgi:hypothetical protein